MKNINPCSSLNLAHGEAVPMSRDELTTTFARWCAEQVSLQILYRPSTGAPSERYTGYLADIGTDLMFVVDGAADRPLCLPITSIVWIERKTLADCVPPVAEGCLAMSGSIRSALAGKALLFFYTAAGYMALTEAMPNSIEESLLWSLCAGRCVGSA